ncbi:transcriptional regulator [Nocardiopsis sp. MG754419]|uniref:transcriptional regulator n=1 Tax=Nocardiopsis sp. MG754419 TaxID=2259865 RepID=UPI001BA49DF7|nr:transcriptional regulator [Nocardiopsis sp. MG754419]MBR8740833.1 transcriptional regulator [Nocardiopsis sp. MG754419]
MEHPPPAHVGTGYPARRLAESLSTAASHDDPDVRRAAEQRAASWLRVLGGMSEGTLTIGSRTPVRALPAWVTPEVAHGGFATGSAAAGGPLRPHELALIERHGLKSDRGALYTHHLSEPGLAHLGALLDSGGYELDQPEQAALLTVVWLLRAGDTAAALRLLSALDPFAASLCLTPRPAPVVNLPEGSVFRWSVGSVRTNLDRVVREPARGPAAQREALAVWNPFTDRVLAHWWETTEDGVVDTRRPSGWRARGDALLDEYERLAAEHTLCTKHRDPKENLAILLAALRASLTEGSPDARRWGLLQHAVTSMVAKRGVPGSDRHSAVRAVQAAHAALPTHAAQAALLRERLAPFTPNSGLADPDAALVTASHAEAREFDVPEASVIAAPLRAKVERAVIAPLDTLVERGLIPSAEVMAGLVPTLAAAAEAAAIEDPSLARLVASHHRAFAARRSLLLLNLASQVRREELPWVREAAAHHATDDLRGSAARSLITRLGATMLTHFPGTITPNPLVRELNGLARTAGSSVRFVEELAADIFMRDFSTKYVAAARSAADLLEDGLYARYYGIDTARVSTLNEERGSDATSFAALCTERAGRPGWSVAGNGTIIEQAQILTTHNLAALVQTGARPADGWAEAARRAYLHMVRLVGSLPRVFDAPAHVKNAAFAWRQTVFLLSRCPSSEQRATLEWMERQATEQPYHVRDRLAPPLAGLRAAVAGEAPSREEGVVFLGWTTRPHWMLRVAPEALSFQRNGD